jgi:hypothetical protein
LIAEARTGTTCRRRQKTAPVRSPSVLFNSPEFLFVFLPLALAVFLWLRRSENDRLLCGWLTLVSLVFYGYWRVDYVPIILGSIVANFTIATAMARYPARRRALLATGVTANLLLLGAFKYSAFLYRDDGLRDPGTKQAQLEAAGGQHALFVEYEDAYVDGSTCAGDTLREEPFAAFGRLLAFAADQGIALDIVLDPVHARRLELYALTGRWPSFEAWKRRLTAMVAAHRRPGGSHFELWDFTGYNAITTEPVPAPGDRTASMSGYWEGSHYTSAVGDRVLDIVFGRSPTSGESSFGVRLEPETVDRHLALIRHEREAWRRAAPRVVGELTAIHDRYCPP